MKNGEFWGEIGRGIFEIGGWKWYIIYIGVFDDEIFIGVHGGSTGVSQITIHRLHGFMFTDYTDFARIVWTVIFTRFTGLARLFWRRLGCSCRDAACHVSSIINAELCIASSLRAPRSNPVYFCIFLDCRASHAMTGHDRLFVSDNNCITTV